MNAARRDRQAAARLWHLCLVDGSLDERRARHVVECAVASPRHRDRAILPHFLRLLRQDRARHSAHVESAVGLDLDLRTEIGERLVHQYGEAVATTYDVVPSLIGGVRVTVGSDVYDGSVRGRLDALAARFEGQP